MTTRESSIRAYRELRDTGVADSARKQILKALLDSPDGLTRREIEHRTGLRPNQVSGRVNDLIKVELVNEIGERECSITGRRVMVCAIAVSIDDELEVAA